MKEEECSSEEKNMTEENQLKPSHNGMSVVSRNATKQQVGMPWPRYTMVGPRMMTVFTLNKIIAVGQHLTNSNSNRVYTIRHAWVSNGTDMCPLPERITRSPLLGVQRDLGSRQQRAMSHRQEHRLTCTCREVLDHGSKVFLVLLNNSVIINMKFQYDSLPKDCPSV
jgi:hypothetical protein